MAWSGSTGLTTSGSCQGPGENMIESLVSLSKAYIINSQQLQAYTASPLRSYNSQLREYVNQVNERFLLDVLAVTSLIRTPLVYWQ